MKLLTLLTVSECVSSVIRGIAIQVFFPFRQLMFFGLLTGARSTSKLSEDQKGNTWQSPCIVKNMTLKKKILKLINLFVWSHFGNYCNYSDHISTNVLWIWNSISVNMEYNYIALEIWLISKKNLQPWKEL